MNTYRFFVGLTIAFLFAAQPAIQSRLSGSTRTTAGYAVSLMFLISVAEFAALPLRRSLIRKRSQPLDPPMPKSPATILTIASILLVLNLFSKKFSAFLPLPHRGPPTIPLLALVAFWFAVVWFVARRGWSKWNTFVALGGLVLGTRILVLGASPFDRLIGDMLANIDQSLSMLFSGRFPYVILPKPMPYLPGTFLAYAPAKLLGIDLRFTNLALDLATVALAAFLVPRGSSRARSFWLPLFMLHPIWTSYGVNTQFSPSLFATALFGFAVLSGKPRAQAIALGFAVGTNQMLGALGLIVFAHWLARFGGKRAIGLASASLGIFLAMIAPFLCWNPRQFLYVSFLIPRELSAEIMAGRFTLLPLLRSFLLLPSFVPTLAAILSAAIFAYRAKTAQGVLAAMAIGLCAALLMQPTSFTQYFLPVLVLAAIADPIACELPDARM